MEDKTITAPDQSTGGINGIAVDASGRALAVDETPQPTTTSDQGAAETPTVTENQQGSSADDVTNETSNTSSNEITLQIDEDLAKWASNKGVSITSDSERKLAEMALNSEKAMHTKASEASTLQKSVTAQAPELNGTDIDNLKAEIQSLKLEQDVRNFYQDNPDAKLMDAELSKLVEERPHLAYDLEALYAVAKFKNSSKDAAALKQDGGREALESLANKQRAAVASGNATTNQTSASRITPQNVDALVGANSQEWYMEHRDEINKAMEA
jgi:hypothetical protein